MHYYNSVPASTYAITLAEAKAHLRVTHDSDDNYIDALIAAAQESAQQYTGRQIMVATWKLFLDCFTDVISITKLPVNEITTIQYYDENNELKTLETTQYKKELTSIPATIEKADNVAAWPSTYNKTNAVIITFKAGYLTAAEVPADIKHAIKLTVGNLYDYRDNLQKRPDLVTASERLLTPYVIPAL